MACAGCDTCDPKIGYYEVHVTSLDPYFEEKCNKLGYKHISVTDAFSGRLDKMTSVKIKTDVITDVYNLAQDICDNISNVVRVKLESHIDSIPHTGGYYESHIEVTGDFEKLKKFAKKHKLMLSYNSKMILTKKSKEPYNLFALLKYLDVNNFIVNKVIREYTFFDTNPNYDSTMLS